jgi:hypothetical protein
VTRDVDRQVKSVTVVSMNSETLDGLQTYLRGAGVVARCTRSLAGCTKLASEGVRAIVLFPDDYRWEKVVATLADLGALRPPARPVIVTAFPQRFEKLTMAEDVIIMPRPVWGWTILDAIRAQIEREEPIR